MQMQSSQPPKGNSLCKNDIGRIDRWDWSTTFLRRSSFNP